MKTIFAVLTLTFATLGFAETCFKATTTPPTYSKLPEVVCVKSFGLTRTFVEDKFAVSVVTDAGIIDQLYYPELVGNKYKVNLKLDMLEEREPSCGSYYNTQLAFSFEVSEGGQNIEDSLSVSALETSAHDGCHSRYQTETIPYVKM